MNNKAWLRIAEAFFAILIVAAVLIFVVAKAPRGRSDINIHDLQRSILTQISLNETMREEILSAGGDIPETQKFIKENLPAYFNFTAKVCNVGEACGLDDISVLDSNKEIYSDETIISANLYSYNPKKLRLFIWAK